MRTLTVEETKEVLETAYCFLSEYNEVFYPNSESIEDDTFAINSMEGQPIRGALNSVSLLDGNTIMFNDIETSEEVEMTILVAANITFN